MNSDQNRLAHAAAKHEAGHALVMDIMGGAFSRVVLKRNALGAYAGELEEPVGEPPAHLVCGVAGAVADVMPIGCGDWRVALNHLTAEPCCARDYELCMQWAAKIGANRSLAAEAIETAVHALTDFVLTWQAITGALFWLERSAPSGDAEVGLAHMLPSTTKVDPIPNCPPEWRDVYSIRKWAQAQGQKSVVAR